MSERSVAELIGWGKWSGTGCYHRPGCPGHVEWDEECDCRSDNFGPTVDDLLAWLTDREGYIEIGAYLGGAIVYTGRGNHDRDTLLAALEQMVRAVAGES